MPAQMTEYLSSWDNLNGFVLVDGDGKAIWYTIKTEESLYEFPLWMCRVTHGCVCKEKNLVNTGSLEKCSDSIILFFSVFLAAGHALALPFHLLHNMMLARCWMHKLVTISCHQPGVAQRVKLKFGYPCSTAMSKSCSVLSHNKYVSSGKIWL